MEEEAAKAPLPFVPLVLFAIVALLFLVLRFLKKSDKVTALKSPTGDGKSGKVTLDPQADAAYLANCLRPSSSPFEILFAIATTPDNISLTQKSLDAASDVRAKKIEHLKQKKKEESHSSMDDLLNGEWAEDGEDAEALAAKKAKEEKERQAAQLARATGKDITDVTKVKLEGIDDGVLGQEWVTKQLKSLGVWPPPHFKEFGKRKFLHKGKAVGALNHPAVFRNLLMTMGRLNAKSLNTHPELTAAGPKGNIDPTYFQSTLEYRQRAGMLLEASLRMAVTLKSFRLACSVLNAIVMFKIGLMDVNSTKELEWFKELMVKQYGSNGAPKLIVEDKSLGPPSEDPKKDDKDSASKNAASKPSHEKVTSTDEKMALEMQITRQHAESFTKEKLALCQKQGIPPQIGMQAYREGWFIMVRQRKMDGDGDTNSNCDHLEKLKKDKNPLYLMLNDSTKSSFESEFTSNDKPTDTDGLKKLTIGWPFVISNVAQKSGKVKIHLPPPKVPGKYEYVVNIKSQDFLGCDQEFSLEVDVVQGKEEPKKDDDESKSEEESKKDK